MSGVSQSPPLLRAALGFAFAASAAGFLSIAVSHACLAIALALAIAAKMRWQVPSVGLPIALFLGWTVVSALASGEPAAAAPQFKKFLVFAFLPLIFSLFRSRRDGRRLLEAWYVTAGIAALTSFFQFFARWREAGALGEDFNAYYAPQRITGLFSHWMTFSQAALLALLALVCFLLFGPRERPGRKIWFTVAAVLGASLLLSYTRIVWLASALIGGYLVACRRPRLLWLAPVGLLVGGMLAPESIERRVASFGDLSAYQSRLIMWRTGWNMIQDRPVFGVGPERVGPLFNDYQPQDIVERPDAYYGHLHNIYVHFAAERGLPALVLLLWILGQALWDLGRALRRLPPGPSDERAVLQAGISGTLAVMIVGCADVTLGDSEVLGAYLALTALAYSATERVPSRNSGLNSGRWTNSASKASAKP